MSRPSSSSHTTVLAIDERGVEWLDLRAPAEPRYGRAPLSGRRPNELADAARRAFEAAGGRSSKSGLVLALGAGLVKQRLLSLPELSRQEREAVLLRKAERLWGQPGVELVFSARRVDVDGQAADAAGGSRATWLLSVAGQRELEQLHAELKQRGFRSRSVVALCSAAWNRSWQTRPARERDANGSEPRASIVVSVEPSATSVALISGERFITRYELRGDFSETPALGANLLQDLRNCAGFWRKVSRGGSLERIELIGLEAVRAEPLELALRPVFEDVTIRTLCSYPEHPHGERLERLLACLGDGPFRAELGRRSKVSRKSTQLLVGTAGVAILALVGAVQIDADSERIELEALNRVLSERVGGLERADHLEHDARLRAGRVLAAIQQATSELERGVAFEALSGHLAEAFEGRASLRALSVGSTESGALELVVRGDLLTTGERSMQPLRELEQALAGCAHLEAVRITPGSRVPASAGTPLEFTLRAILLGGVAAERAQ